MRSRRLALLLTTLVPVLMQAASPTPPRFSVALMDTNTSPRVDFAKYAFGKWLADNPIPAGRTALIRLAYVPGMDKESCPAIVCCGGRMDFHGAPLPPARSPTRLPSQDQFLRWLDRGRLGKLHP